MPSPVRGVLVETTDPAPLVRFWSALLDRPMADDTAVRLDNGMYLRFAAADTPKRLKNRVHIDLASDSVSHQADLVCAASGLGAQTVDVGQRDVPWVVLADPGGNEFCILEPRDDYRGIGPIAAVVVDALDPVAQARFWSQLTRLPVTREDPRYASLRQESRFWVEFILVAEPKTVRNRLHLVLDGTGLPPADPEGNEILTD